MGRSAAPETDTLLSAELLLASRMRAQSYLFNALLHDLRAPLHALEINLELLDDDCRRSRGDPPPAPQARPAEAQPQAPDQPVMSPDGGGLPSPTERRPGARARRQSDQIVAVLKEELARLNRALRMLLDHGAPQPPVLDDVDLAALLRELAVLLRPQARQQRVTIELELAQSLLLVHGQREQLRQALLNIAINALEAMPAGGTLTLSLSRVGTQARVAIADSGPGVPAALLERDRFASRFTTKPDGIGMGLFVAQLIASGHGGCLEIANRDGGHLPAGTAVAGAEVTLILPIALLRAMSG